MKSKAELRLKEEALYDAMGNTEDPILQNKLYAVQFLMGEGDPITDEELSVPKTDADLDNLIQVLEAEKKTVPEYSAFGDPNWKITEAQIEIVRWAKN